MTLQVTDKLQAKCFKKQAASSPTRPSTEKYNGVKVAQRSVYRHQNISSSSQFQLKLTQQYGNGALIIIIIIIS